MVLIESSRDLTLETSSIAEPPGGLTLEAPPVTEPPGGWLSYNSRKLICKACLL